PRNLQGRQPRRRARRGPGRRHAPRRRRQGMAPVVALAAPPADRRPRHRVAVAPLTGRGRRRLACLALASALALAGAGADARVRIAARWIGVGNLDCVHGTVPRTLLGAVARAGPDALVLDSRSPLENGSALLNTVTVVAPGFPGFDRYLLPGDFVR